MDKCKRRAPVMTANWHLVARLMPPQITGHILLMRVFVFVGLLLAAPAIFTAASAENRFALVIGINRYDNLPPAQNLQKAVGDAEAVSAALTKLGYRVETGLNVDRREFNRLWARFVQQLKPDDVAVFDFSGHGVELSGSNYLILRDAPQASDGEILLRDESVPLDRLLEDLRARKTRVSFFILDACRTNPFSDRRGRSLGGARGLAGLEPPKGSFVMYSAGLGQAALDRLSDQDTNPNSVYTRTLLPFLTTPGLSLSDIAKKVRSRVRNLALGAGNDQTPAYYDELLGDFFPAGEMPAGAAASLEDLKRQAALSYDQCDKLAASPFDEQHRLDGVKIDDIDASHAIPACRLAVATNPNTPKLMYQLGRALNGNNDPEARDWYEKAAALGDPLAMLNLGTMYGEGKSIKQDYAKAREWYEKSAALGNTVAMTSLSRLYYDALGVKRDYAKAIELLKKAADLDDMYAMNNLGVAYKEGIGVPRNYATARSWFEKAAAKGDRLAMTNLGHFYAKGLGVRRNSRIAKIWYGKARSPAKSIAAR
jgi:tetratricopeptide (TPR) repeat protein